VLLNNWQRHATDRQRRRKAGLGGVGRILPDEDAQKNPFNRDISSPRTEKEKREKKEEEGETIAGPTSRNTTEGLFSTGSHHYSIRCACERVKQGKKSLAINSMRRKKRGIVESATAGKKKWSKSFSATQNRLKTEGVRESRRFRAKRAEIRRKIQPRTNKTCAKSMFEVKKSRETKNNRLPRSTM